MTSPDIFDRNLRRLRRDRAAPDYAAHDFLRAAMLDGIAERLASVTRTFSDILDLGCFDGSFLPPPGARTVRSDSGAVFARMADGIQHDEDRPAFPDASFDLIISNPPFSLALPFLRWMVQHAGPWTIVADLMNMHMLGSGIV